MGSPPIFARAIAAAARALPGWRAMLPKERSLMARRLEADCSATGLISVAFG
jgi:hypothetical protein